MKSLACLLLLALPLPLAGADQGPQGLAFSATVSSIKISAQPGQVVTRQFRLTLDANQPRTHFKARVEDWWQSEDGRQSFYAVPGTLKRSCATWTTLNPVESAIGAGETLVVRITATVPTERAAGGYWCVLTVDEVPDPLATTAGVGMRFVASVSTGIFIYIDPVDRAAQILDMRVEADHVLVKVRNMGNAPIGIEGHLEFFAKGATTPIATADIPRTTVLTEPIVNGICVAKLPPESVLPTGHYRVRIVLDIGAASDIGAEREIDITRKAIAGGPIR